MAAVSDVRFAAAGGIAQTAPNHDIQAEISTSPIPCRRFRSTLRSVSLFLAYEAVRQLEATTYEVMTPIAPSVGVRIDRPPLIVPILRTVLGMLDAATAILTGPEVAFVDIAKDGHSTRRECYLSTLPDDIDGERVIMLGPMLATGYTAAFVCDDLLRRNAGEILLTSLLSASEGIDYIECKGYPGKIFTAAVDTELNNIAFIVPGLGDAGDRQFGKW